MHSSDLQGCRRFYETKCNRVNIDFSSHYGPVTGRKVKSLTYSNHVSGPVVREKITFYELVKKVRVLWKLTVHYCVHKNPLKSEALCDFLKFRVISPSSKSQLPHLSQLLSQHPLSYPANLKSVSSFPNWVRATLWSHCTHISLLYFNKKKIK